MNKSQYIKLFTVVTWIIMFMLITNITYAQLSGRITDYSTGKKLAGANIIIRELNTGQVSDSSGSFSFHNIVPGKYHITMSFVGYLTYTRSIRIEANKPRTLSIALLPAVSEISTVVVTATRSERDENDIPSRVDVITKGQIERSAGITADEILASIPGVYSSRDYGLANKSGNVSMRGLNRNVQTLILVDGVPYTLIDGGASGWNRINPETIERIEILKGPDSYMYGSNAMGGVINIITKRPVKPISGMARAFYGSWNTIGGFASLQGKTGKKIRGFYWSADGFYRKSDGYLMKPDSTEMWYDIKAKFNEYNAGIIAGYRINSTSYIEAGYTYAYDWRSTGIRYYEPDGSFTNYYDHVARIKYHGNIKKISLDANAFYKKEESYKQSEGVKKKTGAYTFSNTESPSEDYGLWTAAGIPVFKNNLLTVGIDVKRGSVKSSDIYRTSTDTVSYSGKLDYAAFLMQDEGWLFNNKLKFLAGLRYDYVRFYAGDFLIKAPSLTTVFLAPFAKQYSEKEWTAVSPKLSVKYILNKSDNVYLSYSKGFRPATLSDLCKTGDVEKGFKIANTGLIPEKINSIELGGNFILLKNLSLQPTLYYSVGKDFQYFVATGDSMATTGETEKPVIMRRNINTAVISGAELALRYIFIKNIELYLAYTWNSAKIKDFTTDSISPSDLSGKILVESPEHIIFSGIYWSNRYISVSVNYKYRSKVWIDDENTLSMTPRSQFDAKITGRFSRHLTASVTTQNVLNKIFTDSKGLPGPGRIITTDITFNF
ncbi:MAG: TonB-dependent receptor [Bacteroidota bacterium]